MVHLASSVHQVPDNVSVSISSVVENVTCAKLAFMAFRNVCHAPVTLLGLNQT